MTKDKIIVIGDKVDLVSTDNDVPFRAKIEDVRQDGMYIASIPAAAGLTTLVRVDNEMLMIFYRESGRYSVRVKIVDFLEKDRIMVAALTLLSTPEKDQRRQYYRLSVRSDAVICEYIENIEEHLPQREDIAEAIALENAGTKDVSITGVALITKNEYKPGEKYLLKLYLDETPRGRTKPLLICAEVMRTEYDRNKNTYRVGMNYFGQTKSMSEYLARYVFKQEQKQVMQRRLVEGE